MASAVVVGAGVFGTSIARRLALDGWEVALVDQYPPGHVRAASGGESRLIRCAHGADRWYARSARRARTLWRELEEESGTELLVEAGVVWLAHGDAGWEAESETVLREEEIPSSRLRADEAAALFPSCEPDGVTWALLEPEAGVLRARDATRALAGSAVAAGARFVGGRATPAGRDVMVGGERLGADVVVWACGAWLASLFPGLVELRITRQEVLFFGAPIRWQTPPVPAWVDYDAGVYGLGDLDGRGVKVAPDAEGPPIDPDWSPRTPDPEVERDARGYLERRFPALAEAPVVGSRVCQYALTADTNFIVAPHPEEDGVWIVGGGSGHGFKHGPALGEYFGALLAGREQPAVRFALGPRPAGRNLRTAGVGGQPA
jgi:sarcosine oxidase